VDARAAFAPAGRACSAAQQEEEERERHAQAPGSSFKVACPKRVGRLWVLLPGATWNLGPRGRGSGDRGRGAGLSGGEPRAGGRPLVGGRVKPSTLQHQFHTPP